MSTGVVKWYHSGWKRGVITPDGDGDDVLFRQRAVEGDVELDTGDRVEFEAEGQEAVCVRRR